MKHTGSKNDMTITTEIALISAVRAAGLEVFYEYSCNSLSRHYKIDFVVGKSAGNGEMYIQGMTGVELKTSMSNLCAGGGLNIKSFPYNYILVPEYMAYAAIKYMMQNEKRFWHVGLLVLREDYSFVICKYAEFINPNPYSESAIDIEKENPTDYQDSVAQMVSVSNPNTVISVHNFQTGETRKETWKYRLNRKQAKDKAEKKTA